MLEHFWRSFFFFFGWCLMFLPYFFVFFLALVHLQVSYACAWYFVRGLGTLLCTLSHGLHVWSRDPVGSILRRLIEFLRRQETISNLECGQASGKKGPESSSEETSPQDFLLDIIFLY